jgi:exonuclease 1
VSGLFLIALAAPRWQVSKSLRFTCAVPRSYEEDVQRAVWTFRHQRVFCPQQRRVVHLRPLPPAGLQATAAVPSALAPGDDVLEFLGAPLPDDVACQVAAGGEAIALHS